MLPLAQFWHTVNKHRYLIEFEPRPNLESEITQIAPRRHYDDDGDYYDDDSLT